VSIFAFLSLISGVLIFALGLFVFDQNRKSPQHILFLLLCLFASYWAFTEFMMLGADSLNSAYFWMKMTALWTFVPPLALNFIVVFIQPDSWKKENWIYPALYTPALIFCWIELSSNLITTIPLQAFGGYTFGYSQQTLLPLIEISWAVALALIAAALSLQFYYSTKDNRKKQQVKLILTGIGITTVIGLVTQQILPGLQFPIPDLTSASFLCFVTLVGYAIWKYRLFILNPATVADKILSTMTDGLIITDMEETVIEVNQTICTMLGYQRDEIVGQVFGKLFCEESDKIRIVTKLMDTGSISDLETKFRMRDGTNIPVSFSGTIIKDCTGNVAGIVSISRNMKERKRTEESLNQARKKLQMLNAITFSDIQSSIFTLEGYFELEKMLPIDEKQREFKDEESKIIREISQALKYASIYQNLGLKPPVWQNVCQSFLLGISHLDTLGLQRRLEVDNLEIYADPMLENVFLALADNVVDHSKAATAYSFTFVENSEGLHLIFEDNGEGVPLLLKDQIFEREFSRRKKISLYLCREILSITDITILENGEYGTGAWFEILVPRNGYRFKIKTNLDLPESSGQCKT